MHVLGPATDEEFNVAPEDRRGRLLGDATRVSDIAVVSPPVARGDTVFRLFDADEASCGAAEGARSRATGRIYAQAPARRFLHAAFTAGPGKSMGR